MKHIVWKLLSNFEKEEKYLNEMSAKGLALTDYTWCRYVFQDAPRGEFIYRIELLDNPVKHPESQNYIKFMEETGAEFVTSYNRWVYFRRKASEGEFDIYTDIDSKIKHYKRIKELFLFITILNLGVGFMNLFFGIIKASMMINSINLYMGVFSIVLGLLLLTILVLPLSKKIRFLVNEKNVRE